MKFESFISYPASVTVDSGILLKNRELLIGLEDGQVHMYKVTGGMQPCTLLSMLVLLTC